MTGLAVAASATLAAIPTAHAAPPVEVTTVASGLTIPWGVVVAPDGTVLTGERRGQFIAVRPGGERVDVRADLSIFAAKEAGLMGLAIDPRFDETRRVYSCQAETTVPGAPAITGSLADAPVEFPSTGQTVRVVSWRVSDNWTHMVRERTLVDGIPVNASGRHAGCGLAATADSLYVGTGDNATPWMPQSRTSLGGKVLHVGLDGAPAGDNPDRRSPVHSLGHRNVQGVAVQPGTGRVYAIEQGTTRDDELNRIVPGGNYGYRPDRAPLIYDESVPMTDPVRVPGAIGPVWSSGDETIAPPGLAFLPPTGWGPYSGGLVITALKGKRLIFMTLSEDGRRVESVTEALRGTHGRLRGVAVAPDGSLVVSTSDGGGADRLLRLRWAG